ncbi:Anaphase-promoting complex subunit 1 [Dispira simplex]|nr:Anaphase-promoting complex subunit 1 [Dispira simplex]
MDPDEHPREDLPALLYALHLHYEDLKLNLVTRPMAYTLGQTLMSWAQRLGWSSWVRFYEEEGLTPHGNQPVTSPSSETEPTVPSLTKWITACWQNMPSTPAEFPRSPGITPMGDIPAATLARVLHRLLSDIPTTFWYLPHIVHFYQQLMDPTSSWEAMAEYYVRIGWTRAHLNSLSPGVAIPIREVLRALQVRSNIQSLSQATLLLVGRPDLAIYHGPSAHDTTQVQRGLAQPMPSKWRGPGSGKLLTDPGNPSSGFSLSSEPPTISHLARTLPGDITLTSQSHQSKSSYQPISYTWLTEPGPGKTLHFIHHEIMALRFNKDQRIREVSRLLQSHKPVRLPVASVVGVELDPDETDPEQVQLRHLANRTLAQPLGRAMFQYASTLPITTERFPIPGLRVAARFGSSKTTLDYQAAPTEVNDLYTWPTFHNGVAAALSISPDATALDNSWILLNQVGLDNPSKSTMNLPTETNLALAAHAGWLFGLGLNRHLRHMVSWQAFHYLATKHTPTSVGVLLGLAAAYRGTADSTIARLLAVHIPALMPANASDLQHSPSTIVAGLVGMGLLYSESCHRRTVEILQQEVTAPRPVGLPVFDPTVIQDDQSESYALGAGIALGLVTLARGERATGLADLNLVDSLRVWIDDPPGYSAHGSGNAGVTQNTAFGSYLDPLGVRENQSLGALFPPTHSKDLDSVFSGTPKLTLARTTAAILALAMMYHRTNDPWIIQILGLPNTTYRLKQIHPTVALLRSLGRWLVGWQVIHPSLAWLLSSCPALGLQDHTHWETNPASWRTWFTSLGKSLDETLQRVYLGITSGAALALGLKYAGSADTGALNTLLWWYDQLRLLHKRPVTGYEAGLTRQAVRQNMLLTIGAVAMIQAGRGDLEVFRRLRSLHGRLTPDMTYGDHVLVHMAMGLLFLGAGNYTLSAATPLATAALACSFFPYISLAPNDNRGYLQPLRHLWVLAVDSRCVVVRDWSSRQLRALPVRVQLHGGTKDNTIDQPGDGPVRSQWVTVESPGFLPPWSQIEALEVAVEDYWSVRLEITNQPDLRRQLQRFRTIWTMSRGDSRWSLNTMDAETSINVNILACKEVTFPRRPLAPTLVLLRPPDLAYTTLCAGNASVCSMGPPPASGGIHKGPTDCQTWDIIQQAIVQSCWAVDDLDLIPVYQHLIQTWTSVTASPGPQMQGKQGFLTRQGMEDCDLIATFYTWGRSRLASHKPTFPLHSEPLLCPHFVHMVQHDLGSLPS